MQILRLIKRHFKKIYREDLIILFRSFVRPHLECCAQAWSPFPVKDVKCLEQVQRRSTKLVEGLDHVGYVERMKLIRLQSLENRRLRGDLIETFRIITGIEKVNASDFFKFSEGKYNLRRHKHKLSVERSRLDIRRHFFSQRVVNHWNRLPAAAVEATVVNSFKTRLDDWFKSKI